MLRKRLINVACKQEKAIFVKLANMNPPPDYYVNFDSPDDYLMNLFNASSIIGRECNTIMMDRPKNRPKDKPENTKILYQIYQTPNQQPFLMSLAFNFLQTSRSIKIVDFQFFGKSINSQIKIIKWIKKQAAVSYFPAIECKIVTTDTYALTAFLRCGFHLGDDEMREFISWKEGNGVPHSCTVLDLLKIPGKHKQWANQRQNNSIRLIYDWEEL